MKAFVVGAMLAALGAGRAFTQFLGAPSSYVGGGYQSDWNGVQRQAPGRKHVRSAYRAYAAVTSFGNSGVSGARAAATRACSAQAVRYNEYTWGNMEFQQYRACMAQDGQVE